MSRILLYFGHTVRRGDKSLEKPIVIGKTKEKRLRALTRWTDPSNFSRKATKEATTFARLEGAIAERSNNILLYCIDQVITCIDLMTQLSYFAEQKVCF